MKVQRNPGLLAARKFITALIALVVLVLVIWSARIAFVRAISRAKIEQRMEDCFQEDERFQEEARRLKIQIEQQKRANEEEEKEFQRQWKKINGLKVPGIPDA